ncbi:22193_t:CDS:2 [Gigaspora margarita]|uniref:22193_t:CDS:1 n=1 Tax=Gigaspora margarita TaxID=4874 RepID=A0ABN7URM4_GIGMA|nr:22193_t:CDS:2 [Gigaspora margarita]
MRMSRNDLTEKNEGPDSTEKNKGPNQCKSTGEIQDLTKVDKSTYKKEYLKLLK